MAEEVNLLSITLIVMFVIFLSIILAVVLSPLIDKVDYEIGNIDSHGLPTAGKTMHTIHDYFYYVIFAVNVIMIIWWFKSAWASYGTYTRVYQQ